MEVWPGLVSAVLTAALLSLLRVYPYWCRLGRHDWHEHKRDVPRGWIPDYFETWDDCPRCEKTRRHKTWVMVSDTRAELGAAGCVTYRAIED